MGNEQMAINILYNIQLYFFYTVSIHANACINTHTVENLPIFTSAHFKFFFFFKEPFLDGQVEFFKCGVRYKHTTLTSTGQETFPFWCYGPKMSWKHSYPLSAQGSGTGLEFLPKFQAQSQREHPLGSPAPVSECQEPSGGQGGQP